MTSEQIMALLSPEDQDLTRLDLMVLGMFTVTCDYRGVRRVDPNSVRVPLIHTGIKLRPLSPSIAIHDGNTNRLQCNLLEKLESLGCPEVVGPRGGQSIGVTGIAWHARAERERRSVLRWGDIARQINTDTMLKNWALASVWPWDYDKLPIWRKTDPGAQ